MDKTSLFYQQPTKINAQGFTIAWFICLFTSIFLGYIYTLLNTAIPLIYFAFIINIGIGLLISLCIRIAAKITHNASKKSQIILALMTGILVNYFQWVTYLLYVSQGQIPSISNYLKHLILPIDASIAQIIEINSIGLWSAFGVDVNGGLLSFIWIIEFLIIILVPIIYIRTTKVFPYSEQFNKWYPKYTLDEKFQSIGGINKLLEDLQTNPLTTIEALKLGRANRFTKIHLYFLENEQWQYIDFEKIAIDKQGGKDKDTIVENFKIDSTTAKKILNTFDHKRERIEII